MYRFAARRLGAALAAAAVAPAVAAADPGPRADAAKPADKPGLAARLFGGPDKKKPDPEPTFGSAPARPAVVVGPLDPAARSEAHRLERDAYLRRVDVCDKLREVALRRGDDRLFEQADDLERQAKAVYDQRVARLGVPRADAGDQFRGGEK